MLSLQEDEAKVVKKQRDGPSHAKEDMLMFK